MAESSDSKNPNAVEFQHGLPLYNQSLLKIKVNVYRCIGTRTTTALVFLNCDRETAVYSSTALIAVTIKLVRKLPAAIGQMLCMTGYNSIQINVYHKGSADLHHMHVQGLIYEWVLEKCVDPIRTNYIATLEITGEYEEWMTDARLSLTSRQAPVFSAPLYITASIRKASTESITEQAAVVAAASAAASK